MDIVAFFRKSAIKKETEKVQDNVTACCSSEKTADATEKKDCKPENKMKRKQDENYDQNYDKKKRIRLVQCSWKQEFPWLEMNEDRSAMWCSVCKKHPKIADQHSAFISETGVTSSAIRLKSVRNHNNSRKHKDCDNAELAAKNPLATPLARCFVRLNDEQLKIMTSLFNTAYFCAKEELSFTKYESICHLMEKNGLKLGSNYMNDKQAKNFTHHIAVVEENMLKEHLLQARFFTIMADGSTDVSQTEEEIVYIRTVKNGIPVTNFVGLIEVESGNAPGLLSAIKLGVGKFEIDDKNLKEKLVCLNMDGAAVNLGCKAGVSTLLQKDIPHLLAIHCIAHKLELSVMDSVASCTYLKIFDQTVKGIIKFYQYSPKQKRELKEIAGYLDSVEQNMGLIKQIRWISSNKRALLAIEKNWSLILIHLEDVASRKHDNKAAKVKGYLKELKSSRFLQFLYHMLDVLEIISPLSKAFQSDDVLIMEVMKNVETTLLRLKEIEFDSGEHVKGFKSMVSDNHTYKNVQISGNLDTELVGINNFIKDVSSNISKRFSEFEKKPLSLFAVFDCYSWPIESKDLALFGRKEINELAQYFSEILTNEESKKMGEEWTALKVKVNHFRCNNKRASCIEIYTSVLRNCTEDIKNISLLIEIMFCMSPSTAVCERGFSTMNRIKTSTRNSLGSETLNDLMRIAIDGPSIDLFDPSSAIENWLTNTRGTRHVSGHAC